MNIQFISLSEVKNVYFMCGKAKNEIYLFFTSRDEIHVMFMVADLKDRFTGFVFADYIFIAIYCIYKILFLIVIYHIQY